MFTTSVVICMSYIRRLVTVRARQAARAVAELFCEYRYARRRLMELRIFGRDGDHAPSTYAEFLFRSPVALWREPSARRRMVGAQPR